MKPLNLSEEQVILIEGLVAELPASKNQKSILTKIRNARKPPIKVASRKAKGRELQYWVCRKIATLFNVEFNQQDDNCPIHSREMGLNGKDIIVRGDIGEKFPYDIECKACEQLDLANWITQARDNTGKGRDWLLVVKNKKIGEPIVVMNWDAFERTYRYDGK